MRTFRITHILAALGLAGGLFAAGHVSAQAQQPSPTDGTSYPGYGYGSGMMGPEMGYGMQRGPGTGYGMQGGPGPGYGMQGGPGPGYGMQGGPGPGYGMQRGPGPGMGYGMQRGPGPGMGYGMQRGPGPGMGYGMRRGPGPMGPAAAGQQPSLRQQMMLSHINQRLGLIEQELQASEQVDPGVLQSVQNARQATERALQSLQAAMQSGSDTQPPEFSAAEEPRPMQKPYGKSRQKAPQQPMQQ